MCPQQNLHLLQQFGIVAASLLEISGAWLGGKLERAMKNRFSPLG